MSKTYRDLPARPAPRVTAPAPTPTIWLLKLCRNCGEAFTPTGPHVDYCRPCQLPAERRAYRRTERQKIGADA